MDKVFRKTISFIIAMALMALSVVISTRANLGISPISTIPYVISLFTALSLGTLTFIFNVILFILGIIVMGRDYKPIYILSVIFVIIFSYLCDLFDGIVPSVENGNYLLSWILTIIAALFLAFGIALSATSSLTMLPGDFFARFVASKYNLNFGYTKLAIDLIFIAIAAAIGLIFMGSIEAIREGTLFFIVAVGPLINVFMRVFKKTGYADWVGYEPIEITVRDHSV